MSDKPQPAADKTQPAPIQAQPVQAQPAAQPAQAQPARGLPEREYAPESTPRPQSAADKIQPGASKAQSAAPKAQPADTQPTASSAAAPQPPAAGGLNQQALQQNWARIKALVKRKSKMAEGLLNSARSVVLKGDVIVLGFQSEVVKSKMETPENIDLVRQAVQETLGVQPGVRCAVVGGKSGAPVDLEIDGDGMVGTALDLGGKIVYEE